MAFTVQNLSAYVKQPVVAKPLPDKIEFVDYDAYLAFCADRGLVPLAQQDVEGK